jgi:FtsP/CotA-like multicopper oxidase with cupredoxin domain
MATYEIEIRTTLQTLDVGPPGAPVMANLEVYNGKIGPIIPNDFPAIPGPLNPGDELIVRLVNDLPIPTGIHWHGIELQSNADGTPVTQDPLPGGNLQVLGGEVDSVGGTYLYKFRLPRPGIFWFHPHHFHSTNRVFRGSYGMIVVTDPNEAALIPSVLPPAA